ncbi:nucleoside deaminase [Nesterenkonia flava]|uniref:tRNA-specific adenosine deaminase n=1 Tax=Nesterenkonia flava TaxID=469799 RepID=A0ABU1FQT2_9MICC|nr:nucleoside deaminase [Nesterenkonia flava]MDR5711010.1 nucleoside deaminase [Nesterenkonia flava]
MAFSPRDPAQQHSLLGRCLELASQAPKTGDVPVGALVVDPEGRLLGEGFNTRERDDDPSGHAEVNALRAAARTRGTWRLDGCVLAVTLEPCPMCAGAISQARIAQVIFGAWDEKAGAAGSVFDVLREPRLNHWVEVHPGVRAEECAAQLREFFERFRSGDSR